MRTAILAAVLLALGAAAAPSAHAAHRGHRVHVVRTADGAPGETVALDPNTGDYRIAYFVQGKSGAPGEKTLRRAVFVPATKIDPVIESDFVYRDDREVHYAYRIANGRMGREGVVEIILEPVSDLSALLVPPKRVQDIDVAKKSQLEDTAATALATPANWTGHVTTSAGGGLRIGWRFDAAGRARGILPGRAQAGFGMPANDLPGIVLAKMTGDAPALDFRGDGPDGDIRDRLNYLAAHNYVTRPIAVPGVAIPDPFDAALLVERIQAQVHTWILMNLIDPLFSARLDHHFAAAANALRQEMPEAARFDLDSIHTLLAVQDPGREAIAGQGPCHCARPEAAQIDPLAARVLEFNLKYVEMRLEEQKNNTASAVAP